jgi:hypothetical protein
MLNRQISLWRNADPPPDGPVYDECAVLLAHTIMGEHAKLSTRMFSAAEGDILHSLILQDDFA